MTSGSGSSWSWVMCLVRLGLRDHRNSPGSVSAGDREFPSIGPALGGASLGLDRLREEHLLLGRKLVDRAPPSGSASSSSFRSFFEGSMKKASSAIAFATRWANRSSASSPPSLSQCVPTHTCTPTSRTLMKRWPKWRISRCALSESVLFQSCAILDVFFVELRPSGGGGDPLPLDPSPEGWSASRRGPAGDPP